MPTQPEVQESPFAPTTWGQSPYQKVECPSGQKCMIRKMTPEELLAEGVLEGSDQLTGIAAGHADDAKGPQAPSKEKVAVDLANDPESMRKFVNMVDKVVLAVVVEPKLVRPPDDYKKRALDVVYLDTVGFKDRVHIFHQVFKGSRDLENFRTDSGQLVGNVEPGQGVPMPS